MVIRASNAFVNTVCGYYSYLVIAQPAVARKEVAAVSTVELPHTPLSLHVPLCADEDDTVGVDARVGDQRRAAAAAVDLGTDLGQGLDQGLGELRRRCEVTDPHHTVLGSCRDCHAVLVE